MTPRKSPLLLFILHFLIWSALVPRIFPQGYTILLCPQETGPTIRIGLLPHTLASVGPHMVCRPVNLKVLVSVAVLLYYVGVHLGDMMLPFLARCVSKLIQMN